MKSMFDTKKTKAEMLQIIADESKEAFNGTYEDGSRILNELQELSFRVGDGHKWCNYEMCVKSILMSAEATDADRDRALMLYAGYNQWLGREVACTNIQRALMGEENEE